MITIDIPCSFFTITANPSLSILTWIGILQKIIMYFIGGFYEKSIKIVSNDESIAAVFDNFFVLRLLPGRSYRRRTLRTNCLQIPLSRIRPGP